MVQIILSVGYTCKYVLSKKSCNWWNVGIHFDFIITKPKTIYSESCNLSKKLWHCNNYWCSNKSFGGFENIYQSKYALKCIDIQLKTLDKNKKNSVSRGLEAFCSTDRILVQIWMY